MGSNTWQIEMIVPREAADPFTEALDDEESSIISMEEGKGSVTWLIQQITQIEPQRDEIQALLEKTAAEHGLEVPDFTIEELPEVDWVEFSLQKHEPVHAGRFFVYGSHSADLVPDETINILIEATCAFGTGQHETTKGCLLAIDRLATEGFKPQNPFDLGCGSAVLAMAIAKVWGVKVLGSDIDEPSIVKAEEFVKLNGEDDKVKLVTADGYGDEAIKSGAPYDLTMANILAKPLIALSDDIIGNLTSGGYAVLSGFLLEQADDVIGCYESKGMTLVHREDIGEWVAATLQKK